MEYWEFKFNAIYCYNDLQHNDGFVFIELEEPIKNFLT